MGVSPSSGLRFPWCNAAGPATAPTARTTSPIRPRADAGTAASEAPARCLLGAVVRGVCGVTPRGRQRATVTEAAPGGGGGVYGAGGARSTAASEA